MTISLGGIIVLALVVCLFVIGMKVKGNSQKLQELEELMVKES